MHDNVEFTDIVSISIVMQIKIFERTLGWPARCDMTVTSFRTSPITFWPSRVRSSASMSIDLHANLVLVDLSTQPRTMPNLCVGEYGVNKGGRRTSVPNARTALPRKIQFEKN